MPSLARTHRVSVRGNDDDEKFTLAGYVTCPNCDARTMLPWFIGSGASLTSHRPPASPPVFQKSYCIIGSPSGSLAMNRVEAAKDVTKLTKLWIGVTTGPGSVALMALHAPNWMPSLARTHIVSVPAPARYVTCESWE